MDAHDVFEYLRLGISLVALLLTLGLLADSALDQLWLRRTRLNGTRWLVARATTCRLGFTAMAQILLVAFCLYQSQTMFSITTEVWVRRMLITGAIVLLGIGSYYGRKNRDRIVRSLEEEPSE